MPYRAESGSDVQKNGWISFFFFFIFFLGNVRVMVPCPLNVWEVIVVPTNPSQVNLFIKSKFGVLGPSPHPPECYQLWPNYPV